MGILWGEGLQAGQPPQELRAKHTWRTREDPLVEIRPQAQAILEEAPDLEAKTVFEYLWEAQPWAVQEKHLRTFQRRVKLWRLAHGPPCGQQSTEGSRILKDSEKPPVYVTASVTVSPIELRKFLMPKG